MMRPRCLSLRCLRDREMLERIAAVAPQLMEISEYLARARDPEPASTLRTPPRRRSPSPRASPQSRRPPSAPATFCHRWPDYREDSEEEVGHERAPSCPPYSESPLPGDSSPSAGHPPSRRPATAPAGSRHRVRQVILPAEPEEPAGPRRAASYSPSAGAGRRPSLLPRSPSCSAGAQGPSRALGTPGASSSSSTSSSHPSTSSAASTSGSSASSKFNLEVQEQGRAPRLGLLARLPPPTLRRPSRRHIGRIRTIGTAVE
ncbi:unnamed protein product [Chilo suppressalis]|uniref:Uncharacterized protein n=1 Tax=Chilo suppressalis TaxID=168631 RepID=A0ABN8B0B0_CHISP|nr:unnamed protein product [Chilo suppressalis]